MCVIKAFSYFVGAHKLSLKFRVFSLPSSLFCASILGLRFGIKGALLHLLACLLIAFPAVTDGPRPVFFFTSAAYGSPLSPVSGAW